MELTDAVRTRRSIGRLTEPAPTDDELCALVADAATGPDHGLMRPWRLVLVRTEARDLLGEAMAADLPEDDEQGRSRAAAKPLRAPLLVSIVFTPRDNPKVPNWEQLAAAVSVVHTLSLLLHERGWGVMWRTGPASRSARVGELLGVTEDEQLLGWLYVGTPSAARPAPRPELDVEAKLAQLCPDGSVTALPVSVS